MSTRLHGLEAAGARDVKLVVMWFEATALISTSAGIMAGVFGELACYFETPLCSPFSPDWLHPLVSFDWHRHV
jgi:hypothetical protein